MPKILKKQKDNISKQIIKSYNKTDLLNIKSKQICSQIVKKIFNDSWYYIMISNDLPNEDFECTCHQYSRYGCKRCRTGCYID